MSPFGDRRAFPVSRRSPGSVYRPGAGNVVVSAGGAVFAAAACLVLGALGGLLRGQQKSKAEAGRQVPGNGVVAPQRFPCSAARTAAARN